MILTHARIAQGPRESTRGDILVEHGRIFLAAASTSRRPNLDLAGFLLLPGLINAHDHLEFNLFPALCKGPYGNAKEWAEDIYQPSEPPIREHLSLSEGARLTWGGLKNLLSGVTTVAHHNPSDRPWFDDAFPVHVVKRFGWAHSIDFSPDLVERFRGTAPGLPFILHAAEGIDERARAEVGHLDALGVLTGRTVLVHAIGLDQPDLDLLQARQCSIVWCPTSNLSLFGEILPERTRRSRLNIALGTDSAMTAQTDLIAEVGVARRASGSTAGTLYEMVTSRSARLLRLREGEGFIQHRGVADLVAIADRGQDPADALEDMYPELVIVGGTIKLISPRLLDRLSGCDLGRLHGIALEGRGAWFTTIDVASLHLETVRALGPEYRLAGRRISL